MSDTNKKSNGGKKSATPKDDSAKSRAAKEAGETVGTTVRDTLAKEGVKKAVARAASEVPAVAKALAKTVVGVKAANEAVSRGLGKMALASAGGVLATTGRLAARASGVVGGAILGEMLSAKEMADATPEGKHRKKKEAEARERREQQQRDSKVYMDANEEHKAMETLLGGKRTNTPPSRQMPMEQNRLTQEQIDAMRGGAKQQEQSQSSEKKQEKAIKTTAQLIPKQVAASKTTSSKEPKYTQDQIDAMRGRPKIVFPD